MLGPRLTTRNTELRWFSSISYVNEGMGKTSRPRLYTIIVSEKQEEDKHSRNAEKHGAGDGWRPWRLQGFPPLGRLSKGLRRSLRRARTSLASRISWPKTGISHRDSGYTESSAKLDVVAGHSRRSPDRGKSKTNADDCQSVDSGLESDESLGDVTLPLKENDCSGSTTTWEPLSSTHRTRSSSHEDTSPPSPLLAGSTDIVRKSSNLSSRTTDSGILSERASPQALPTHTQPPVPKKRVSILLPGEQRRRRCNENADNLFGPHLRVERTQLVRRGQRPAGPVRTECIRTQRDDLMTRARHELSRLYPTCSATVRLIFHPSPNLDGLDADQIGQLLFNLRTILFGRQLATARHFEVCLFLIQVFLLKASHLVEPLPGMPLFPSLIEQLIHKSEKFGYARQSFVLKETQAIYIDLWCCLLRTGLSSGASCS